MSTRKIVKNTVYFGVVPKLTLLINVMILPLITPYLTTFDYGVQGIIASYTGLIVMIAPLGMSVHLTNSFFEYPRRYPLIWGRVLFLFLLSGAVFGLVNMLILTIVLPFGFSVKLVLLSLIGSIQVIMFANSILAQHLFPLVENPKPLVFGNLFASCIGIAVSFVMVYYLGLGYWGLVASMAVSTFVSFIVFIKYVWIDFKIFPLIEKNRKRLKEMFRVALPLVPHSLGFVLLTSSARIVMTWHKVSYDDIGLYSHGCTMGEYILVVTTALTTAIAPQMQVAYRNGDFTRYRKLYYLCQSVALLSSALVCIWMGDVYSLLIRNDQLSLSSNIAMLMCFANVIYPFYCFMSTPAFIEKNTKQLLWLVFLPGVMNIIICYAFIPVWGYRVAIYSTMLSYWSQLVIPHFIRYYNNSVSIWFGNLNKIWILLFMIVFVVVIANFLGGAALLWRLIGSVVIVTIFAVYYYSKKINLAL